MPERINDENTKRCNRLERALYRLFQRSMKSASIDPLKQEMQEGEAVKKRAIITLLNKTMSQSNRIFMAWHKDTQNDKQILKCRTTISFFEGMESSLKGFLDPYVNAAY